MFEYKKDYTFTWPVKVLVPTDDGQVEQQFTGRFRLLSKEETDAARAEIEADLALARKAWTGWKDDLLQGGKPLAFSDEAREELLALPFVRFAVAKAYWDAANGALRLKN